MSAPAFDLPTPVDGPDFQQLQTVLQRRVPDRPVQFEFFVCDAYREALAGFTADPADPDAQLAQTVAAYRRAGYDYATVWSGFLDIGFATDRVQGAAEASVSLNAGAVITDAALLDAYRWPDPDRVDYGVLERVELPDGMQLMGMGPGGVLENTIELVGYETLCFALMDGEDWVAEVFRRVGACLVRHYTYLAAFDSVGLCIGNDDWGFRSQPMLAPEQLREHVFPWHRRIVEAVHAAGKPAVLHSCGNFTSIAEDIVAIGYDGKHSYEDAIMPVEEAYDTYGDRFAILGGIDVDYLCRAQPDAIYRRCRSMLEHTAEGGGYALGSGNSIPDYVPAASYEAMLRAGLEAR